MVAPEKSERGRGWFPRPGYRCAVALTAILTVGLVIGSFTGRVYEPVASLVQGMSIGLGFLTVVAPIAHCWAKHTEYGGF